MPTFIDESGDTGHSPDSSPFFRLAAVCIGKSESNAFRFAVRELRRELNLAADFEFKFAWTHSSLARRNAFFSMALMFDWRFAFCTINKRNGRWPLSSKDEQHWVSATCLACGLRSVYHEWEDEYDTSPLRDQVLIDDNGDREFLESIWRSFSGVKSKKYRDIPMVRRPKFRKSHQDEALQLTDMICGASGARVSGDSTWYDLIAERCCDFTEFP